MGAVELLADGAAMTRNQVDVLVFVGSLWVGIVVAGWVVSLVAP